MSDTSSDSEKIVPVRIGRATKTLAAMASFVVICAGLHFARPVVVPALLAAFVAVVTVPIVVWMRKLGAPRFVAISAAILFDIAAVTGLGAAIAYSLTEFYDLLPLYQQQVTILNERITAWLLRMHIDQAQVTEWMALASPTEYVETTVRSFANLMSNLVMVMVLVILMLFEGPGLRTKVTSLVKVETLSRFAQGMDQVNQYLLVKTATSLLTGIAVGLWTFTCGMELPILWGLIAFMLSYVPTIGAIISGLPILGVALLELEPANTVLLAGGYVLINFAIGVAEPRIFGRALGLSPLVVFLSIVFWGWLLGPVGALLSVPMTMVVKIILRNTQDLRWIAVLLGSAKMVEEEQEHLRMPPRTPTLEVQPTHSEE